MMSRKAAKSCRFISVLQPPRFLGQHDRDAVADRIGELGGARDQLLLVGVVVRAGACVSGQTRISSSFGSTPAARRSAVSVATREWESGSLISSPRAGMRPRPWIAQAGRQRHRGRALVAGQFERPLRASSSNRFDRRSRSGLTAARPGRRKRVKIERTAACGDLNPDLIERLSPRRSVSSAARRKQARP